MSNGSRRSCLGEKTEYKKSRETVPLICPAPFSTPPLPPSPTELLLPSSPVLLLPSLVQLILFLFCSFLYRPATSFSSCPAHPSLVLSILVLSWLSFFVLLILLLFCSFLYCHAPSFSSCPARPSLVLSWSFFYCPAHPSFLFLLILVLLS